MKVYEYGQNHGKTMLMFQCAAEPGWVFFRTAEAVAEDFHVFLVVPDGHDEQGTDFISVEKYAKDAVSYLQEKGIKKLDLLYGCSMGGGAVMHWLAYQMMPVKKAIVDGGITPYSYPKWICRLIAIKDYLMIKTGYSSVGLMKKVMPPERWTPEGEDPDEHYRRIYEFGKVHFSGKTIYNVFWSANNYSMPEPVPAVDTEMEYWYGEEEKKARKDNLAYARKAFPQITPKEFKGLEHAELLMMFPDRFHQEVMRFWNLEDAQGKQKV